MVAIHPTAIKGRWHTGIALDYHTMSSRPIGSDDAGHMQFETVRPEIAELLYRLKYKGEQAAAQGIITAAVTFLQPHRSKLDRLVPVPPSTQRIVQPVMILARGIGAALDLPIADCVTTTQPRRDLKSITDPETRQQLVAGRYAIDCTNIAGKKILLFDDLFRSGTTMNAITDLLLQCGATTVRALTITRTRINK